jgi:type IV pilus assembly protein PilQ
VIKFFLLLLFLVGVPASQTLDSLNVAYSQDDVDLEDGLDDQSEDTLDEAELDADLDEGDLDSEVEDSNADSNTPPESLEEDESVGEVQPQQAEESVETPTEEPVVDTPPPQIPVSDPVTVTAVDFKSSDNGGTIVITATGPMSYTSRTNQEGNQFILELDNTRLPNKFKLPFNTKEFSSNIGFFQGYQGATATTARFVIQLRDSTTPNIVPEGNQLLISTGGGAPPPPEQNMADNEAEEPQETQEAPAPKIALESSGGQSGNWDDSAALNTRTLDEFLLNSKKFYGHPISIEVKDTDIRDVFNLIAEESGLNLILSDAIAGKITLKLREIPWDQALVVLMQSKQLGYVRQGNILRIETLAAIRSETDATRQLLDSTRQLQPLRVQVFPISYARAKQLETQVKDFLSPRGKVNADERTNALVVTDIAESIVKIRKLLKALDTQTPQVLIEGKVVEARESFERKIGFILSGSGQSHKLSGDKTFTPAFDLDNATGGNNLFGLTVGTLDIFGDLTGILDMMEAEDVVKVISSPRVVTLNNIEALIKQSTEVPVFTTTLQNGERETTVEYKELNLQLKVTPQITADGGIIMRMFIERQFAGSTIEVSGASAAPIFGRSAQTTVIVNNGETAVIGGIYQNDNTESEQGIPLLRKIPILGHLFKGNTKVQEKNELLIFLTPRVLNREAAFGGNGQDQGIIEGEEELDESVD